MHPCRPLRGLPQSLNDAARPVATRPAPELGSVGRIRHRRDRRGDAAGLALADEVYADIVAGAVASSPRSTAAAAASPESPGARSRS